MARAGRKRKQRGYLASRYQVNDGRDLAALQPHRVWLPPDKRLSEKAATPFGGLNLTGAITDEQYEAGQRYIVVVAEYRASIGVPMEGHTSRKNYRCLGERDCQDCECRRRKAVYDAAFEALGDAGHIAQRVVARVTVHGEPCPYGGFAHLRHGLDRLVKHFGLDRR